MKHYHLTTTVSYPHPTRLTECPECNGEGGMIREHARYSGNPEDRSPIYTDRWVDCPKCAGRGEIEIDVQEEE